MTEILWGWAGTILHILLTALAIRLLDRKSPAALAILCGLAAYTLLTAVVILAIDRPAFWAYTISFGFGSICFLMVFGAVYKSISLRVLLDLLQAPGRSLETARLMQEYVRKDSFERRIDVMVENGFARSENGSLVLLPKGRRIASSVQAVQNLFAITRSG